MSDEPEEAATPPRSDDRLGLRHQMAARGILLATTLGMVACSSPPPPEVKAAAPVDPCAADRARARELLERGKLHRAGVKIEAANRRCPTSAPASWGDELRVLVALGDDSRARELATRIEAAADAPEAARRAAKEATATLSRRATLRASPGAEAAAKKLHAEGLALSDKGDPASLAEALERFVAAAETWSPAGESLLAAGLTARWLQKQAAAQALFDRAARELEGAGKAPMRAVVAPVFTDGLGMRDLAWSPGGDRIAASNGGDVVLLDVRTYREVLRLRHGDSVRAFAFSPDGKTMVTAALRSLYLWDLPAGTQRHVKPELHSVAIQGLAFSPDGSEIASGAYDGKLAILDGRTLVERAAFESPAAISSLAYSPDGKRILSGVPSDLYRRGRGALVWDRSTGKVLRALAGHTEDVVSAVFSPDGAKAATASWDNTVRLWDVASGKTDLVLSGHENRVERVAFSPDGKQVASTSWDETTRLWDVTTGKEVRSLKGFPHPGDTWGFGGHGLAISPDGQRVASALGRTLRVWDARSGAPRASAGRRLEEAGYLEFSADSAQLWVTDPKGRTSRTWGLSAGAELTTEEAGLGARPASDRFSEPVTSPDGRFVARARTLGCADLVKKEGDAQVARLCTVPGQDGGLVLVGSLFEYTGNDRCAARELLACEIGESGVMLPVELCEDRFFATGLLAKAVAAGGQSVAPSAAEGEDRESPAGWDCPTSPY